MRGIASVSGQAKVLCRVSANVVVGDVHTVSATSFFNNAPVEKIVIAFSSRTVLRNNTQTSGRKWRPPNPLSRSFTVAMAGIRLAVLLYVLVMVKSEASAQPAEFNYDESKVPRFELPDALISNDGTKITTADEWITKRRPEILQLFQQHVFGTLPEKRSLLRIRQRSRVDNALNGKAVRREITVFFSDDDNGPAMDLLVYTPTSVTGPVPCILGLNFDGNHTVDPDPVIHITESLVRNDKSKGISDHRATEESRGSNRSRWPVELIVSRGYGLATVYCGDIDPDFDDDFRNGIHALTEADRKDEPRSPDAGGSISAWSWGLSHALDVLETDSQVDGERVAVFGFSRLGKTALWAGASDTRFAMVISNDSGCGGAALSRRHFGETVKRINTSFPHWFCLNHRKYNDNENAMPVDHHMLMALIAPRPVYVASAEKDQWADPRGEMLSLYYAGPVFELFGPKGLPSDVMPKVNEPILTDVGYHIRTGPHDVTDFDWTQFLNLADLQMK